MPYGSRVARAYSRHSERTRQPEQTSFARYSRDRRSPFGSESSWPKKRIEGWFRQAASPRQAVSTTGAGSMITAAMVPGQTTVVNGFHQGIFRDPPRLGFEPLR